MANKETVISLNGKWKINDPNSNEKGRIQVVEDGMLFINESNEVQAFHYKESIDNIHLSSKDICVLCKGDTDDNAAGYLSINGYEVSVNGETIVPVRYLKSLSLVVYVNANSSLLIREIKIVFVDEQYDLCDDLNKEADILVVTPTYPSYKNLYLSAFAHSRNKAYRDKGLNIQVASLADDSNHMSYMIDGIPVYKGKKADLKKLIKKRQYKVLVIHFVDENIFSVLDGFLTTEKVIFICHGPETLFEVLPNKVRPYFTPPLPEISANSKQKEYVTRYSCDSRIEWVFVSDWLKKESEKVLGVSFKNVHVIGNFINEKVFPYVEKRAEDRKRILIIRKYDNISQHSIDQVVLAIRELARRPFFGDLAFSFYGDGNFYNELLDPLRNYPNISFFRTFLPQQEIAKVHKQHGILLLPSRHDAHAVSMSEGASSGLVVIGSNVTSNPYFMDDENNHTMVDPEDPLALADVIERLYYDPEEFLAISKRLSDFVHTVSSREATIDREISLIEKCKEAVNTVEVSDTLVPDEYPAVTLLVYADGDDFLLNRCLFSLSNHKNVSNTEIIIAYYDEVGNRICKYYEEYTKGIVRGIDVKDLDYQGALLRCVEEARGSYLKIIYGKDWLDSNGLAELVEIAKHQTSDMILSESSYDFNDKAEFIPCVQYDNLRSGSTYYYDDLLLRYYGFGEFGPILQNVAIKTELVKKSNIQLSNEPFQSAVNLYDYCEKNIKDVNYCNLNLYRINCDVPMTLPTIRKTGPQNIKEILLTKTKSIIKAAVPYGIIRYKQHQTK